MSRSTVYFDSQGETGNIWFVMALATKEIPKEASCEMVERVIEAESYQQSLAIVREYVDLIDVSGVE